MCKKGVTCLILGLILTVTCIFPDCQEVWGTERAEEAAAQEEALSVLGTGLHAKAAVLMDADTGRVLYEKNGESLLPMASTTKIMTCIIALEYASQEDIFTASSYAASMPKVHMGVHEGQRFYLRDLLRAMMLESYNDAAVIIAEGVAGSVEEFAALMNQKAMEIGATHTHFVTPNGLDADGHQTTAADLALIMAYCIQNEDFLEITRTASHTFTDVEGKSTYSAANLNAFLNSYEGALSGKTGFTGNAGYCYVGAAERDGKRFTIALLACGWPSNRTWKWADARKLFDYGFTYYEKKVPTLADMDFPAARVKNGQNGIVPLTWEGNDLEEVLLSPLDALLMSYEVNRFLEAPVTAGEQVGTVYVRAGNKVLWSIPIVTASTDEKQDYRYMLRRLMGCVGI
jgi:D-alanyl-D-alanine carboxypeptidase (penicillin-binding protein 5/6)